MNEMEQGRQPEFAHEQQTALVPYKNSNTTSRDDPYQSLNEIEVPKLRHMAQLRKSSSKPFAHNEIALYKREKTDRNRNHTDSTSNLVRQTSNKNVAFGRLYPHLQTGTPKVMNRLEAFNQITEMEAKIQSSRIRHESH